MGLIKMFGLAALATVAATAFVGTTSASANTSTQLCLTHTTLTCSSAAGSVAMRLTPGTVWKFLVPFATVLCLEVGFGGTPLGLASPQEVHLTALYFNKCGTKSTHENCEIEVTELPLGLLLKTGLDEGTLTFDSGQVLIFCQNVIFEIDMHCIFDLAGTQFSVGGQQLTANKVPVTELGALKLCSGGSALDGTLVTTENRYILG